jgi:hypothetical protein
VVNLSAAEIVVSGWKGPATTLAPMQEATLWSGPYPHVAPEYPLFGAHAQSAFRVRLEVSFNPPVSSTTSGVLNMAEDAL